MRKEQKRRNMSLTIDVLSRNFLNSLPEGRTRASQNMINSVLKSGAPSKIFSIGYPFKSQNMGQMFWNVRPDVVGVSDSLGFRYSSKLLPLFDAFSALMLNPFLSGDILYLINLNAYLYASIIKAIQRLVRKNAKLVMHAFHPLVPETSRLFLKQYIWLLKKGVIDHIFCINRLQKRHFSNYVADERVHYIPYPIDTQKFKPRDMMTSREVLNLPTDREIIGYIGHLGRARGILDLLMAFSKLIDHKNAILALTYSPFTKKNDLHEFRALSKHLGIADQVRFINPVVTQEHYYSHLDTQQLNVEHFYNAMDIMVLPFQSPHLPIDPPLTIIESLASGTPLVTTSIGAVTSIIDEDNALFIPPKGVDEMTNAIQLLLEDDAYKKKLSLNARKYVTTNLSFEIIARKIRETFETILG